MGLVLNMKANRQEAWLMIKFYQTAEELPTWVVSDSQSIEGLTTRDIQKKPGSHGTRSWKGDRLGEQRWDQR